MLDFIYSILIGLVTLCLTIIISCTIYYLWDNWGGIIVSILIILAVAWVIGALILDTLRYF